MEHKDIAVEFAIWMDKKRKSEIRFRLAFPTNELFKEFWEEKIKKEKHEESKED